MGDHGTGARAGAAAAGVVVCRGAGASRGAVFFQSDGVDRRGSCVTKGNGNSILGILRGVYTPPVLRKSAEPNDSKGVALHSFVQERKERALFDRGPPTARGTPPPPFFGRSSEVKDCKGFGILEDAKKRKTVCKNMKTKPLGFFGAENSRDEFDSRNIQQ